MSYFNITPKANLPEAQASLAKLLPHLPRPRISEQLDCYGIQLPKIGDDRNLPVREYPSAVMEQMGSFVLRLLPEIWLAAYYSHTERQKRGEQLRLLHPVCLASDGYIPRDLDENLDGVVAGILLMAAKPLPGPLRSLLYQRATTHWWGAFFALHGIVMADEFMTLLNRISADPRLVAGLWFSDKYYVDPLLPAVLGRSDLWSAIIALDQPLADLWLGRVFSWGEHSDLSALTAIILQPTAPPAIKEKWIQRLQVGPPRLAYLAARWSRYTWQNNWAELRDRLKKAACSDRGLAWFHWYRDIQNDPDSVDRALRANDIEILWQAELVDLTNHHGQYLKTRMINNHPNTKEVRLTWEWLKQRQIPRP